MSTESNNLVGAVGKNNLDSEATEPNNSKQGGKSGSIGKLDLEANESENSKRGGKSGGEGSLFRRQRTPSVEALWIKQPLLPPQMTTKMKGLLKGLRYISQIFEPNSKEQEMQIGYPTDVKHVAHIGWDGPSVNSPSWMNEFRMTPEFSSAPLSTMGEAKEKPTSTNIHNSGGIQDPPARDLPDMPKPAITSRRHQSSGAPPLDSPTREQSNVTKQSRRHQSTGSYSPIREQSEVPRHPRRHHGSSPGGSDSPKKDPHGLPKKSHRKKKESGSLGGGSSRSSRSKALASNFSDPDVKNDEQCPPLKSIEEGI
ncbi:CRIB domain-containing protein RIC6-like [Tasmannia lanceolata]|uniref:CRIB domain-containing protein RIC6-like n=1 Tax=Tasmannia lanceolata TaxID=3420 RepID=UPI0040631A0B